MTYKFADDVCEAAQKAAIEAVSTAGTTWKSQICAFAVYNRKNGKTACQNLKGTYCHADISSPWRNMDAVEEGILVNAMKPVYTNVCPEYVLWVFQGSPYSHAVVNKDDSEHLLTNGSIIDMKLAGRRGALWLCKAVRYLVEEPWKATNWKKLVDLGVDPLMAFIGASIIDKANKPDYGGSHCGLVGYNTPKALVEHLKYLKEAKPINDGQAAKSGQYGCGVWGSPEGKKVKKPDGWGGYTEVQEAGSFEAYAKQLITIAEKGAL